MSDSIRKLQVFVSSTFTDLKTERQTTVAAILENRHIPAGMELFSAGDQEQLQVIYRWIDESDIYMLLLGARYGSIEPISGKSYTELEYDYAVTTKKPFFAIVMSNDFVNKKIHDGGKVEEITEQNEQKKLKDFRSKVMTKMCSTVNDHKDIRIEVGRSIRELERQHKFVGWKKMPDDLLADLTASTQRLAEAQDRIQGLETELGKLRLAKPELNHLYGGRTFQEVCDILSSKSAEFEINEKVKEIDLLTALSNFSYKLARGVSNVAGSAKLDVQLYFRVASVLSIFELVDRESATGTAHSFVLSAKGKQFVSDLEFKKLNQKKAKETKPKLAGLD